MTAEPGGRCRCSAWLPLVTAPHSERRDPGSVSGHDVSSSLSSLLAPLQLQEASAPRGHVRVALWASPPVSAALGPQRPRLCPVILVCDDRPSDRSGTSSQTLLPSRNPGRGQGRQQLSLGSQRRDSNDRRGLLAAGGIRASSLFFVWPFSQPCREPCGCPAATNTTNTLETYLLARDPDKKWGQRGTGQRLWGGGGVR